MEGKGGDGDGGHDTSEAEYDSAEQEVEDQHKEFDYEFDEDNAESMESPEYEEWWRTVERVIHEPDEEECHGMAALWLDAGFRHCLDTDQNECKEIARLEILHQIKDMSKQSAMDILQQCIAQVQSDDM
jgi:hypothetical protein